LIEKLQKIDPDRCVYIQSEDYHYLELQEGCEVEDADGICILTPQFHYINEQGELI
jgi:hypothetical protein